MKKTILLILVVLFFQNVFSQNASTYFPSSLGFKWYYKNIPLDSNNNPMFSQTLYRIDSFAMVSTYSGLNASIVRSKDYMATLNQNAPYFDTAWFNFQSTNAYQYLTIALLPDTVNLPVGILNFFRGLQGWYNMYQFSSPVGTTYQLFSKDTTIMINSIPVKFRAKASGKRLADEVVQTVNGTYTAKKFAFTSGLYTVILIQEVPLVIAPDTIWIATNNWMVKRVSPTVNIDLSLLGYGTMNVPGKMYIPTTPVGIKNISTTVPDKFELSQNYPNPFNPVTIIKYMIAENRKLKNENSLVTLRVYDILGKEVATLVNEKQSPGTYEVSFDGSGLTSGIYFYKLEAGDFVQVRKMMLIK